MANMGYRLKKRGLGRSRGFTGWPAEEAAAALHVSALAGVIKGDAAMLGSAMRLRSPAA